MLKYFFEISDVLVKGLLIILFSVDLTVAQEASSVATNEFIIDGDSSVFFKVLGRLEQRDKQGVQSQIKKAINEIRLKGYLTASLDSTVTDSTGNHTFFIYTGTKYELDRLTQGNLPYDIARKCKLHKEKNSSYRQVSNTLECIINHSENNGYPFATVKLDSLKLLGNDISMGIAYKQGPAITYDSLKLRGSASVKPKFLSNYLNVPFGGLYHEKDVKSIPDRLNGFEYLSLNTPPSLEFVRERAIISLDLKKERVNRFNFLLGFLPNQTAEGGLLITGELDLSLQNIFSKGRKIDLHWERFQEESQRLDLSYFQPIIFSTKFDLAFNFNLLKQDSSFLRRDFDIQTLYSLDSKSRIGAGFFNSSTNTLSGNSFQENSLPEFNSTTITQGQLSYRFNKVLGREVADHRLRINANLRGGIRRISPETEVDESVYDSVDLQTPIYNLNFSLSTLKRIKGSFYLHYALEGKWVEGGLIFGNESLRLGGFNSLRGFNEEFFFAEYYVLNKIEARVYYDYDGYFFLFYDQSFLRNAISERNDSPYGIGLGMSLKTKSGIFKFAYAFGQSNEQDFNTRNGKIHFGYTATF
ncbi:MAG: hypothetical protein AAF363_13330 [Bacteroidota bacterium]